MTARAMTVALALAITAVGCSRELPSPEVATKAPDSSSASADERVTPSSPEPRIQWESQGTTWLEWSLDGYDRLPIAPTDPPPTHLELEPWSRSGELLAAGKAPWKQGDRTGKQRDRTEPGI